MKIISGEKRRDYEVTLTEYVRVCIMLLLVSASHTGIEYHNYFDPAQGSPER